MRKSISDFLSDSDREEIIKAVEEAEKRTSGEIVPMIVPYCGTYAASTLRGTFILSFLTALVVSFLFKNTAITFFIPVFIVGIIAFYFMVENIRFLKRFFTYSKEKEEEVAEGALAAFYESGLYRTRDESGVLIFISIFERKVWIIADHGINEKVDPHEWEHIISALSKGIKEKRQCAAIVEAVTAVGEFLHERFPIKDDDTNELENLIIK